MWKINKNCCYQLSYFKAKMHQIQFQLQRSPDLLAEFKGPTSKGREGRGGVGREREWREGKGKGRDPLVLAYTPLT